MDKNDFFGIIKLPIPVLIAMIGSWVRSASDNVKGRRRTAALLTSGFCGALLIPLSNVSHLNYDWLLILAAVSGWVGGDVVLNSISKQALDKLKGREKEDADQ